MAKILIVGLGSIGMQHVRALLRLRPDFEIAALRSNRSPAGQELDLKHLYTWEDAKKWAPDWVWITNPTSEHYITLRHAAEITKSIFIEKPLSSNASEIIQIVDLIKAKNIRAYYGTQLRHHPVINWVRHLIQSKELGRVLSYQLTCGSYLPEWRPGLDYRKCYSARRELGGGVSTDLIHEYDYADLLFGSIKDMKGFKSRISSLEIDTEDICEALIRHTSGVCGHIHLDYYRRFPKRSLEISFERGVVQGDLLTGKVDKYFIPLRGQSQGNEEKQVVSLMLPATKEGLFDTQTKEAIQFFENLDMPMRDFEVLGDLLLKVMNLEWI